MSWKEDEAENADYKLDKYLKKLCDKARLLDIVYNGVVFDAGVKKLQENPVKTQGEIFVFIDECHRTQSGKLNLVMKAILHNAVFVGFTGTPLLKQDKKTTMDVFGRYIHIPINSMKLCKTELSKI